MKRELFLHFSFLLSFFIFISIIKHYLNISYWPFWLGGLVGVFLPDVDHILYVLFLKPVELTSQRVNYLLQKKDFKRSIELLYETRGERRGLIFHTVYFQLIFLILTFWMLSSSGSLFGKGLVLSFSLHLLIDQIVDLMELKSFNNWLVNSPIKLDFEKSKIYWIVVLVATICLGLFV
ncbi:MAG TPA: hypothetical protein VFI61_04265 [Patescibacteria group bacterium]|nr:hypothetical protein [Patescibacteria group bacterium]